MRTDYVVGGIIASDVVGNQGNRVAFMMRDIATDETVMLADLAEHGSEDKVLLGKWFVYTDNISSFMIPAITKALQSSDVIFIDEIASMQLLCDDFKEFVMSDILSNSHKRIFVTIAKRIYDDYDDCINLHMRSIATDVVCMRSQYSHPSNPNTI